MQNVVVVIITDYRPNVVFLIVTDYRQKFTFVIVIDSCFEMMA